MYPPRCAAPGLWGRSPKSAVNGNAGTCSAGREGAAAGREGAERGPTEEELEDGEDQQSGDHQAHDEEQKAAQAAGHSGPGCLELCLLRRYIEARDGLMRATNTTADTCVEKSSLRQAHIGLAVRMHMLGRLAGSSRSRMCRHVSCCVSMLHVGCEV